MPRHADYRYESACARLLAIAAVAIGGEDGLGGTFVAAPQATATEGLRHGKTAVEQIIRGYPEALKQSRCFRRKWDAEARIPC
jgi:hypothetical protein